MPSLFSPTDSSDPTSALPTLASLPHHDHSGSSSTSDYGESDSDSEYVAPLSGHAPDPSIDGTSVGGGEGGVRAESLEEVTDEDKQVSSAEVGLAGWPAWAMGREGLGLVELERLRGGAETTTCPTLG